MMAQYRTKCTACGWQSQPYDNQSGARLALTQHKEGMQHRKNTGGSGTYSIVRFKQNGPRRVIKKGLTLEQAREHTRNPKTQGIGWFDGYEAEK